MYPTIIGLVMTVVGLYLLVGRSIEAMLVFSMLSQLMGGSAALIVPALGGSSIAPGVYAVIFLTLRLMLPGAKQIPLVRRGITVNAVFLIFSAYCAVSAAIMPRLFKGQIQLAPVKLFNTHSNFETRPLAPSSQNVTTAFNIFGGFMLAVGAFCAVRQPRGAVAFVQGAAVLTLLHAYIGLSGAVLHDTPYALLLHFFRNGSYNQLDQTVGGFVRISGIFPETSSYSAFGFSWMVFCAECWLRGIMPRRTGIAAACMAIVLVMATSSSGYAGLAAYAAVLLLRVLLFPQSFKVSKGLAIAAIGLIVVSGVGLLFILRPSAATGLGNMLMSLTVNKGDSLSGMQRAFWAKQGIDAFVFSHGLGVGAGSFRSSSVFTAILGSTGVIGAASFFIYVWQVFKPLTLSTFAPPPDAIDGVGVAASWAALFALFEQGLGAPTCDPGLNFMLFCGIALGLRSDRKQRLGEGQIAAAPVLPPRAVGPPEATRSRPWAV